MNEEEEGFNVSRWAQHAEDEKEEEEEGLFKANAVNEEDSGRDRARKSRRRKSRSRDVYFRSLFFGVLDE